MKYQIDIERLNSIILEYISDEYIPDYGWLTSREYKEDIKIWGEIEFYVNDRSSYSYHKSFRGHNNILIIDRQIVDRLTRMFGNIWIPVFTNWFSDNTSLPIQSVGTYEQYHVKILA